MVLARGKCWFSLLAALAGCAWPSQFAQTAKEPADSGVIGGSGGQAGSPPLPPPAGSAGRGEAGSGGDPRDAGIPVQPRDAAPHEVDTSVDSRPTCPASLEERLTVSTIGVDVDIRYKRLGYDGFPLDESVLFSAAPGGRMLLAFRENNGNRLRVIRLSSQLTRATGDLIVFAYDLGGLVAHDDGSFALLTRRDDEGEQLLDTTTTDTIGKAAVLIHIQGTRELFAQPLTGTSSITRARDPKARDCAPSLNGRLAWNGSKYGAYFAVHGCEGDPHEPYYGDKLVYVDGEGNHLEGGWSWNCSISLGMRLLAEPDKFTALCMSDGLPFAGLNLVTEGVGPRQLAAEKVTGGYSAGRFGSLVRMADGTYMVAWLSRGVAASQASAPRPDRAEKTAHDIALLQLGRGYSMLQRKWLTETPNIAETNLHIAPYGSNKLLVVWDNVEVVSCTELTCWGQYAGTSARLIDMQGNFITPDARIAAPPNSEQDLVVFPNGDVGWAFVPDAKRNYTEPLPNDRGIPRVEPKRQLSIARLRYCE